MIRRILRYIADVLLNDAETAATFRGTRCTPKKAIAIVVVVR